MPETAIIGKYLESELKRYLPGFQQLEIKDYLGLDPARNLARIQNDLPISLESISYFTRQDFGGTAIYDKNSEIPLVDFTISEGKFVGKLMFATGARWGFFELEQYNSAQLLERNLPSRNPISTKIEIMMDFLNETENNMILYGYPERGHNGIFNVPNILNENHIEDDADDFYLLEPQEIYDKFVYWIQKFIRKSKISSASQIQIMLPERLKVHMARKLDIGNIGSVYWNLTNQDAAYYVNNMISATELEGTNLRTKGLIKNNYGAQPNYADITISKINSKDRIIFKAMGRPTQNLTIHRYPRKMLAPYQDTITSYQVASISGLTSAYIINPALMMYVDINNGYRDDGELFFTKTESATRKTEVEAITKLVDMKKNDKYSFLVQGD